MFCPKKNIFSNGRQHILTTTKEKYIFLRAATYLIDDDMIPLPPSHTISLTSSIAFLFNLFLFVKYFHQLLQVLPDVRT